KQGVNLTILTSRITPGANGQGNTIQRSSVTGTPAFRLFDVAAGASLTLVGVTLQNGLASGPGVAADGGAIFNQGTLDLVGVTVQNNTAHGSRGAPGDHVSKFSKSTSINGQPGGDAAGGGIWSNGVVQLEDLWSNYGNPEPFTSVSLVSSTNFSGNHAIGGDGGAAGSVGGVGSVGGIQVGLGGNGG